MKNIIVPTDFSDNANNALDYAIHLANKFECKLHLVHVYKVVTKTGMLVSVRNFMKDDAEKQLSTLIASIKSKLLKHTSLEGKAIEGYTEIEVCNYANRINADMIVMGTQGASGIKEVLLGSNTVAVINKTKNPLLVVPNNYKYQPIKNMAFAVDDGIISTPEVVKPIVQISEAMQSKVKVIHVEKELEGALIDTGIEIYLSNLPHAYHFIDDSDISHGINEFVKENDIQLLTMIHRDRSFLGQIFHSSICFKEAFNPQVPLLILSDRA